MKFARSIAADLVDKRLLPVVVVLVALAFAIPLGASVFSGGGSSKPVAVSPGKTIALPAGTPSPAKALEDVAGPNTPTAKHYTKPELNPFRSTALDTTTTPATATTVASVAKAATPAATTKAATTKTTTTPAKKTTPAKTTTPTPVTSTPSTSGAPVAQLAKLRSVDSYAVDVRVQDATGLRNLADLERLSPVPSATDALAEYLGVAKSGRAADFVLNRGTVVTGPGTCLPSASNCQVVELKPGQIEALLASSAAGPIFQGVVSVTNWGVVSHSSAAAAATARRQESQTGRQLMLATPQPALENLVYSVAKGVVSLLGSLTNTVAGLLNNG
ncbi:MAG TPA: hypothetical protein VG165_11070 [Solirubrobacteraceae bacterium]|jgi:hypothetical protein|nr:hypothetical protein [Solirubrobacteraceae bacterium]